MLSTGSEVRYYDSLAQESACNRRAAQQLLSWLSTEHTSVPARCNSAFQPTGSNACGFFALQYLEMELAIQRGEGPASTQHPLEGYLSWKKRLQDLIKFLETELAKLQKEEADAAEKAQKKAQKAVEAKAKIKQAASEAAISQAKAKELAAQLLKQKLSLKDLPEPARLEIQTVRQAQFGLCSRCRYSSGCLGCSAAHAERYYLKKEAAKRGFALSTEEAEKLRLDSAGARA